MEDPEKRDISCFFASICMFGNVPNQNGFQLFNLVESSSRFTVPELSKAVLIPDGVLATNA